MRSLYGDIHLNGMSFWDGSKRTNSKLWTPNRNTLSAGCHFLCLILFSVLLALSILFTYPLKSDDKTEMTCGFDKVRQQA